MSEKKSSADPRSDKSKAPAAPKSGAAKAKGGKPATKSVPPPSAKKVSARPATTGPEVLPTDAKKEHVFRRKIVGTVTSDRMQKTVVVEVIRKAMHPMYKKYVRERRRYKAHDELNQYKIGDRVEIMEHRPLSAEKRWLVTRLISRPVEA
jgi:small subunit ribosomal protein S17